MQRAFMPSQHYDDFTLSSTGEKSDYEDGNAIHEARHQPHPLKSTLPSQYRRSNQASNGMERPTLPRTWNYQDDNGPHVLQRDFARNSGGEEDVTLSTDIGTAADEYVGPRVETRKATTVYEDDSFIPGVGRGHQRGNGASSYSAHRDLLAASNLPIHPSPGTAARHDQLRLSAIKPQVRGRQNPSPLASSTASGGEDSESGNETSSTSTTSFIMHPQGLLQSKAESTGNHHAFTVTQQSQSPVPNRYDRPKLDARALDEMDRALKKGRAVLRQELPDSPSPGPSRRGTPRGKGTLRSKKEERLAFERGSPAKQVSQRRKTAEGSISSGNDARKPSDSSSNGRKQAGTAGSTTGETLVDDGRRDFLHSTAAATLQNGQRSPFMKLPSGQRMGKGLLPESAVYLPDITGMTSALESPAKTILGVEHRQIAPEVIQARHIQTSEIRLQEFNDLAYYVKSVEQNLDQTQKKIQQVEETSVKCVKEVDALRSEWSHWRSSKGKKPARQADVTEELQEDIDDDYEDKIGAMNEHIAHLNRDLYKYRSTMEQMLLDKAEKEKAHLKKMQEKQKRHNEKKKSALLHHMAGAPLSSSPIKPSRFDEEDEATRLEMVALRKQVNKVAREVERLRHIVDGEGRDDVAPAKSARFASSMPTSRRDIGVGSHSPFVKSRTVERRSSSLERGQSGERRSSDFDDLRGRNSSPPPSVRGFNDEFEDGLSEDDEGNETMRPEKDVYNESQVEPEEDVSVVAQSRAEKTFEVIEEKGAGHDEKTCTVCISKQKREKRREARKDRVHQQARASSFDNLEEDGDDQVFLSLLEAATAKQDPSMALPTTSRHHATIQRLLKELMDEFYHHRLLYCELADELKQFTPEMTRVKRQILAEHVMEAVEGLEYRARRINLLQDLMGHNVASEAHDYESRRGNEKRRKPRNSPPVVDGGDIYRRVASA